MDTARIAELLAPFLAPGADTAAESCRSEAARSPEKPAVFSNTQLESISIYIDLLLRWNARINLTAVRDPEQIVTRHFGESLFAARHLFPRGEQGIRSQERMRSQEKKRSAQKKAEPTEADAPPESGSRISLADVGSGAGFPGLPFKLWAPEIALTLIESNQKKVVFLREVTRALTLTEVNVHAGRAESLAGAAFNVVTLRAVERFEGILPIAAHLLAPRGRLALLLGSAQLDQAQSALPGLSWSVPHPVPLSHSRILVIASSE